MSLNVGTASKFVVNELSIVTKSGTLTYLDFMRR
jgi:hypothetical protein